MMQHRVDTAQDRAERDALLQTVREKIKHHVLPPTALGTRRSTLANKFAAVSHSLRLENKSWHHVQRMAGHFVSLTTDMGTEMDLNRVDGLVVATLFGYWCRLTMQDETASEMDRKIMWVLFMGFRDTLGRRAGRQTTRRTDGHTHTRKTRRTAGRTGGQTSGQTDGFR